MSDFSFEPPRNVLSRRLRTVAVMCCWLGALQALAAPLANAAVAPLTPAQCQRMQRHHVIADGNPVPCDRLARVSFDYRRADGGIGQGAVVVLDAVAPQVASLFGQLLSRGVPLAGAQPMEAFDGDDDRSMAANNTSAFNGRPMTGSGGWSKHAYGVAIDVNPLQNPYVSHAGGAGRQVLPAAAAAFVQRRPVLAGMAEQMIDVFYAHGFLIWGGNWKQPIDYQHFEIGSRSFVTQLAALPPQRARVAFDSYVAQYRQCVRGQADGADHAVQRERCAARWRR